MHHHIAIVQQHPAGFGAALDAEGAALVALAQVFVQPLDERLELAFAGAGADDKVIGKAGQAADVEEQNVLAFLVGNGVYNFVSQVNCVQWSTLQRADTAQATYCSIRLISLAPPRRARLRRV